MIRNTCLISEGSPILAGIATGFACGEPPAADLIFCTRSQWLFAKTCLVIASKVPRSGTGTMLTVPLSWPEKIERHFVRHSPCLRRDRAQHIEIICGGLLEE